jgi:hypothetical protein
MADGLLSNVLGAIDRKKQEVKAGLGLLANNPQEWAAQATARYFPTKEEERQFRMVKEMGGDITQTPYYQKVFDLAQFQGSLKPIRGQSAAEKLGFNKDVYHFSKTGADIKEFVPGMQDLSPFGIGTHVGTKEAAYDRFLKTTNTGVTYPLKIKTERQFLNKEGKPFEEERLSSELYKLIEKIGDEKGVDVYKLPYQERNKMLADYMWKKYDAIPYINDVEAPGSISYIVPSQNIRSKFAKFDPTKAESKDILAGVLPLGLLAEDDKKQKKDMRK